MNPLIFALVMVLAVNDSAFAKPKDKDKSAFEKVLKAMFTPRPKTAAKAKRKEHRAGERAETRKDEPKPIKAAVKTVTVDPEWLARYWELEATWDYAIPEDDLIKWKDGKYVVPIVVFRHYEDMVNTPRRIARPQSDARPVPGLGGYSYD